MVEAPNSERMVSVVVCDVVYQDSCGGRGSATRQTVIGLSHGADRQRRMETTKSVETKWRAVNGREHYGRGLNEWGCLNLHSNFIVRYFAIAKNIYIYIYSFRSQLNPDVKKQAWHI